MQIQTNLRFHLTPVKTAIIEKKNAGKDAEKKEHFYTIGGNVN